MFLCASFYPISRLGDTDLFWTVARVNGLLSLFSSAVCSLLYSIRWLWDAECERVMQGYGQVV